MAFCSTISTTGSAQRSSRRVSASFFSEERQPALSTRTLPFAGYWQDSFPRKPQSSDAWYVVEAATAAELKCFCSRSTCGHALFILPQLHWLSWHVFS
mmetsp:Transcript_10443/g.19219  ORF Transcript_10443/g.19219 Transcript_10443/m.19219 type:complete len:98 (+) Transcript_10443:1603-1896(+)